MKQYLDAVKEILEKGTRKENRTGVDTLSTFGVFYKIDLSKGFPLLTTKKMKWEHIVLENLWFLSGDTTIKFLQDHDIKFWNAWADKAGKVPSAYGNFWRQFPVHEHQYSAGGTGIHYRFHGYNDQICWAIDELKRNPMSRRVVVTAWAPGNAQTSKLPPCHVTFVFNVQNAECQCRKDGWGDGFSCDECGGSGVVQRLCLHLTQRSCDIALGVPYNIAGYAFLLHLFSRFTGLKPGIFAHTLVDAHAYTCKPDGSMADMDHVPNLRMQLEREPRSLPRLEISDGIQCLKDVEQLIAEDRLTTKDIMNNFKLHDYNPHLAIPFKVAV